MSISTKHLALAVSILVCMYTSAFALEYCDLTVDVNSTELQWMVPGPKGGKFGTGPIKPTHVVRLYVVNNKVKELPGIASVLSIQRAQDDLSQAQKDLISTGQGIVQLHSVTAHDGMWIPSGWGGWEPPTVPNCFEVYLYAVSEKEALTIAEAYVEALEREAFARAREADEKCRGYAENMSLLRQKIEETQVEIRNIIRNHGTVISPEDVGRLISSTLELKNSLSIDIAGLEARIAEITKYISAKETAPEVKTRLQQMLVDHNIELAGVLAKLKATDAARDKAEQKYMLSLRLGELRKESDELRAPLMKAEQQREEAESNHRKAQDEMVHPQIFQNKATIYPVKTEK